MRAVGRNPDHLKVLPGAFVVVGDTAAEAEARKTALDALVHPDSSLPNLSMRLGTDVSGFDLDGPLPDIPESNASRSGRQALVDLAREKNLTIRQLAQFVGAFGGLTMVGTPRTIADRMEEWLHEEACDGFNIMFNTVPTGLDDFCTQVVPELQRRGLFRTAYEGTTLRHHLGLPRPANRHVAEGGRMPGSASWARWARRASGSPFRPRSSTTGAKVPRWMTCLLLTFSDQTQKTGASSQRAGPPMLSTVISGPPDLSITISPAFHCIRCRPCRCRSMCESGT